MKEYSVAVIFWDDHYSASRQSIPSDPDNLFPPVLSIGLVIEETEKVIVLMHDLEKHEDHDESTYTVILKSAIVGRKDYGTIQLEPPRKE
jgi:hypothetical protein